MRSTCALMCHNCKLFYRDVLECTIDIGIAISLSHGLDYVSLKHFASEHTKIKYYINNLLAAWHTTKMNFENESCCKSYMENSDDNFLTDFFWQNNVQCRRFIAAADSKPMPLSWFR